MAKRTRKNTNHATGPPRRAAKTATTEAAVEPDEDAAPTSTAGGGTGAALAGTDTASSAAGGLPTAATQQQEHPRVRIAKGVNGEVLLPTLLPESCMPLLTGRSGRQRLAEVPMGYISCDGTPDQRLTLRSRRWCVEERAWLLKNKTKLPIKAGDWAVMEDTIANGGHDPAGDGAGLDDRDWTCFHRPDWDVKDEYGDSGDSGDSEDSEDEEDLEEDVAEKKKKKKKDERVQEGKAVGRLADLHKDWIWISTRLGIDRYIWWVQQVLQRDPDRFDMYIYNDFGNYGAMEVVENIIMSVGKALRAKNSAILTVWSEFEALTRFLADGWGDQMTMVDDGKRAIALAKLIGTVAMIVLNELSSRGAFKGASPPVRNAGLVIALLVKWGAGQTDLFNMDEDDLMWVDFILHIADKEGIVFEGLLHNLKMPLGLEAWRARIEEDGSKVMRVGMIRFGLEMSCVARQWKGPISRYAWSYSSNPNKIGGEAFNIAKMSAAKRKEYSFK